ncbi:hypothetical protein qu_341 [Acanthamoeba polyphaga mimivirus]|nr:hypothetical protein [Mimivirus reunion]WMV61676.1 hypothetical protein qu_341 [Mimivirus sp.]WMV62653.1 hypothetical protein qu_341 [Acanthamoeba polyphaga mimivirus]WMV63630.1 hypothetical protein qu_341 [Mimivirus sp.]
MEPKEIDSTDNNLVDEKVDNNNNSVIESNSGFDSESDYDTDSFTDNDSDDDFEKQQLERLENAGRDIDTFKNWFKNKTDDSNVYNVFESTFSPEFRSQLYEYINEFFNNNDIVTDQLLAYWKILIKNIMRSNRKYQVIASKINVDENTHDSNLKLFKEKSMFRCFMDEEPICYFKENGNNYYVS